MDNRVVYSILLLSLCSLSSLSCTKKETTGGNERSELPSELLIEKIETASEKPGDNKKDKKGFSYIMPSTVNQRLKKAFVLIDVESHISNKVLGIPGAVNIPMSILEERMEKWPRTMDIVVYSSYNKRAETAAEKLKKMGFKKVRVMKGGLASWYKAGFQTESIKNVREYSQTENTNE